MPVEIKYLTQNGEYTTLEFDATKVEDTVEIASEKKEWSTTLVSVSGVPEFKMETCYERVRIPLDGSTKVPYPCAYTRTGTHKIVLKLLYPSDLAEEAQNILIQCAKDAAVYTAAIIVASVLVPSTIPAAIPTAQGLFVEKFKSCVSEEAFNSVTYTITHEQESGDWKRV